MQIIDYDCSQLPEADIAQHMEAMRQAKQKEDADRRRLLQKARQFHFVGGMC